MSAPQNKRSGRSHQECQHNQAPLRDRRNLAACDRVVLTFAGNGIAIVRRALIEIIARAQFARTLPARGLKRAGLTWRTLD